MIEAVYRNENKSNDLGFDLSNIMEGADKAVIPLPEKKKRGRPRKENTEGLVAVENSVRVLNPLENNIPFSRSYEGTKQALQDTINGIDLLAGELNADLHLIRKSRQLKRKYELLSEISGTVAGLVGNRITAIRELNNIITQANRFEMDRAKIIKANTVETKDDDKAVMDMYNAFINTPMNNMGNNINMMGISSVMQTPSLNSVPINSSDTGNGIPMSSDIANSQEMLAVMMEKNPNAKQVVVFDHNTHNQWFDVIDMASGMSVPGPKPAEFIMNDMQLDFKNGVARNASMNLSYPLIERGTRKFDEF